MSNRNLRQNKKPNLVFLVSTLLLSVFVIFGVFFPEWIDKKSSNLYTFFIQTFDFLYFFSIIFFILFCIGIASSRFGRIRLGNDNEKPKYSFFTWIGMLFSAGFGIGLVFWGVAEPMKHYTAPPLISVDAYSLEAILLALRYSMFHWGIHQWAVFTLVGLALSYFQYRKSARGLISSTLEPLIGRRMQTSIDTLAVLATVTGMATSLGMGILQVNGGLYHVFGVPINASSQLFIIVGILFIYLLSSVVGIDRGIKTLSNFNLSLTFMLMAFVLFFGPTVFIFKSVVIGIIGYIESFVGMSFPNEVQGSRAKDWTAFYWAWSIAWAPFVGSFIARVSRGRTIREFVFGVLFVPALVAVVWMGIMGGAGFYIEVTGQRLISQAVNEDVSTALFVLLEQFPFYSVISVVTIILIITFLVTSADSATFVLGMMTSNGNQNPKISKKLVWGVLQAAIAFVLLLASGLQGLQTASLIVALPFTFILFAMCLSIFKSLKEES